ncbi:UNVERIFIED_CONTAM: putative disease resistance protein [Sesamum angustifolium]|uniref:Disease resistance protein n=1 Tax=Sesamum angustifolium TaxID=2727405 RepID=A0AAW2P123_9LAMI
MTPLVNIIKEILRRNIPLLEEIEFEDQLASLRDEMMLIKAFQAEAERRHAADERIRIFARNLADLTYRIEDAIEKLTMQVEYRRRNFFGRLEDRSPIVSGVASEIKEIRNRFEYFTRIARVIGVSGEENSSAAANGSVQLARQTYGHQIDEHFVGRVEEMELLGSYIEDPKCRIIAICGMGGSGKTALAKKLYQDVQDKGHFNTVAWVYVSQDFEPRRILEDLYLQLCPYDVEELVSEIKTEELGRRVHKIQLDRKCLIVLDEIWYPDAWDQTLHIAFPSGDTASKILITTRVREVAAAVGVKKRYIHRLRYLTQHESYQLFSERVRRMHLPGQFTEASTLRTFPRRHCS